jgi:iron complex transport system substrate-binding protein
MIRDLGEITSTQARAAAMLAELRPLYERVSAESAARPPVDVFYAIWRNPYMTVNRDTYISDLLRVCGARNVFADRAERYPSLTLDEVASRRPDVIVLPDEPFRFRRIHLSDFAGYPEVPAVRDGRIVLVDGKPFSWHGPRVAQALRTIPALFSRT